MAKEKGSKGLGAREKQILYILAGLAIVALAYFLGFNRFNESRAALVAENAKLQDEVKKLEDMDAKKAQVIAETEELKGKVGDIYANYPSELRTQNLIDYFDKIEKNVKNLDFTTETFTQNMIYFQNGAILDSEVDSAALPEAMSTDGTAENAEVEIEAALDENGLPVEVTGYHSSVAVSFDASYDNLQKIITYIHQYPQRTTINNINISSSEGKKDLSCNMTVNLYSVGGIATPYDDLTFPEVQLGKPNIFK